MQSTDICNMALSYIGKDRIDSIDDDSETAKQCRIHYNHTRKRMLLAYPWGFARRCDKIALLTSTVPGWTYCYAYPSECLSVQFVFDEDHARHKEMHRQDFRVVMVSAYDRAIATDVDEAYAEFTYDVKDPSVFSEEFSDGLAHLLAAAMAISVTGSAAIQTQNIELAQQAIEQAKYLDAVEQERRTEYPRKYADIRFR